MWHLDIAKLLVGRGVMPNTAANSEFSSPSHKARCLTVLQKNIRTNESAVKVEFIKIRERAPKARAITSRSDKGEN